MCTNLFAIVPFRPSRVNVTAGTKVDRNAGEPTADRT